MTHWIPPFTRRLADGTQVAFCGQFVTEAEHSTEPTCPNCRHLMEQEADALDALRAESVDASLYVTPDDFDPCAGYQLRGGVRGGKTESLRGGAR